jgi:transposase-like protein
MQGVRKQAPASRREHWRRAIAAAEASGESIRGFCPRHGIAPSHYYYWRRKLRAEEEAGAVAGGGFVLVSAAGTAALESGAMLELVVERGWRLRIGAGVDERALRLVLAVLAAQA